MKQKETLRRAQEPARDAPLVLFDLDGTICENSPEICFQDSASIAFCSKPRQMVIQRIRALWVSGTCHLGVLTARNWRQSDITHRQLKDWLGAEVYDELDVTFGDLRPEGSMSRRDWLYSLVAFKAEMLDDLEPCVYVGDAPTDERSAIEAGVPFMGVVQFSRGDRIPGLQQVPVGDFDAHELVVGKPEGET